jgi:hypothetical protein
LIRWQVDARVGCRRGGTSQQEYLGAGGNTTQINDSTDGGQPEIVGAPL